ncbi:MAG: type II toxin-antitoxin system HicA family toxin [Pyrinomonadaceae bacterium]
MRLPRDISGVDLIKALKSFGYEVTRQTGSHVRLSTSKNGTHHITIPNHSPLRIGTLAAILDGVSEHFKITRQALLQQIGI